jgi:signal transduction histidine kinase
MTRLKTIRRMAIIFVFFIMVSSTTLSGFFWVFLNRVMLQNATQRALFLWPLATLLACMVLGTCLAAAFSRIALRPLLTLIGATKKIAKGDFTVRVPEYGDETELGQLMRSFNTMTEELGSIEMLRSDFINTFSHEFKTPIVSIRGFARQLKEGGLTPQQQEEYINIIISESERLATMSSNILLLSKLETQQFVGDKSEYFLDEQIRRCILVLEKQWMDKEIELNIDLPELRYTNNEEMMSHVWLNIIGNAIKFSNTGGKIDIKGVLNEDVIEISIKDEGVGMSKDVLNKAFNKFWQADSSRASEGNGLGLPLVKRIVELSGGGITVKSEENKGTTFTVTLPLEH